MPMNFDGRVPRKGATHPRDFYAGRDKNRNRLAIKLPICTFDAKTGILCANCRSKLARGEISKADVEASKALVGLSESRQELSRSTFKKGVESKGNYILEFEASDLPSLRSDPALTSEMEAVLKGKVWLTSFGSTERKFLEDAFYPTKILTVNTVWLPDGSKRTKVILPSNKSERHLGDFDSLRTAVKEARGIDLLMETEREALLRTTY